MGRTPSGRVSRCTWCHARTVSDSIGILMVTRRVDPAAFVVDSLVPFCTIEDFKEVILEC